jgi:hypothetical protein
VSGLFLIFDISGIIPDQNEQLGSKEKFWLKHPELDRCLFKENRLMLGMFLLVIYSWMYGLVIAIATMKTGELLLLTPIDANL